MAKAVAQGESPELAICILLEPDFSRWSSTSQHNCKAVSHFKVNAR